MLLLLYLFARSKINAARWFFSGVQSILFQSDRRVNAMAKYRTMRCVLLDGDVSAIAKLYCAAVARGHAAKKEFINFYTILIEKMIPKTVTSKLEKMVPKNPNP